MLGVKKECGQGGSSEGLSLELSILPHLGKGYGLQQLSGCFHAQLFPSPGHTTSWKQGKQKGNGEPTEMGAMSFLDLSFVGLSLSFNCK